MNRIGFICIMTLLVGMSVYLAFGADASPRETREKAQKSMSQGNWKDAYERFAALVANPAEDAGAVGDDLKSGILCLQRLGRSDEIDDVREKAIATQPNNWRLLWAASQTLTDGTSENYGFIVAGKFYRGNRHGNDGKFVNAFDRDRVRALQLMRKAIDLSANENAKNDLGEFYLSFADMLLDQRDGQGAWKLQYRSDLSKLPDYEEGYRYGYGSNRGAPVDANGDPVFYKLADAFDKAASDGERWRWCLTQAAEQSPDHAARATFQLAQFLYQQFGVQTMAEAGYGRMLGNGPVEPDDTRTDESGPYAVNTLEENETIARLANGVKRLKLPLEFNYIKLLQQVAEKGRGPAEQAYGLLSQIFEDRQQYDRAAEFWKKNIAAFGPGPNNWKQGRLDQIVGNWGRFEPTESRPAGNEAELAFLFRNGKHVTFEAWELNVPRLLDDVKAYIKTQPNQLDWNAVQIGNIGWRIVDQGQNQYRGKQAAKWDLNLEPRDKHFDRRVTVKTPLKKAGAYLITSRMDNGNTCHMVLWLADTVLVKKPLEHGMYCYVADATTGTPVEKANVEFFGWQSRWNPNGKVDITTRNFAENADADGQVQVSMKDEDRAFQWLITATTPGGRFAYLGFTNAWFGNNAYDAEYNQKKIYVITDRPVYRPGQNVRFKFWVNQAQYDKEGNSAFAGQAFTVQVNNPRGEKVMEKTFTADEHGGFDGELTLDADATLGQYAVHLANEGGGTFRVEEYKKPEYEVKVDAPKDPVMLGEKITATVSARYYFGAPVVNAKVKYKVTRTSYAAQWYPTAVWDWFYEPGYWWFASDYPWYPGWRDWAVRRPTPWWFGQRYAGPPEVVSENEVAVGNDGTVKVEIDTAPAKAVHGDTDHKYEITAEVTDESRRTIVGQGTVLVARKPFKVYSWVDSGFYTVGDAVRAEFSAQTLDNKPVKGKGELRLLEVSYKDNKPVETEVQKWELPTNDEGKATQQIKASKPGQYRLSYTVTDDKGDRIEGGYVFVVRGPGFDGSQFRFNDLELTSDKKEYQPGDTVRLMVNSERKDATVLAFVRASNGVVLPPKIIRLNGKSTVEEIGVVKKDMPNFFVEALTVTNGKVADETREIVVPPENRVINVQVTPSAPKYRPGQKATVQIKLTDAAGKPVSGSTVVSLYDKSVEYVSGGTNVPEIKSFFWKWRRRHNPMTESSVNGYQTPFVHTGDPAMQYLGTFGALVGEHGSDKQKSEGEEVDVLEAAAAPGAAFGMRSAGKGANAYRARGLAASDALQDGVAADRAELKRDGEMQQAGQQKPGGLGGENPAVQPAVRQKFADTALWVAKLDTDENGTAQVSLDMPDNLTTWKAKVWSIGSGARVGQGEAEVVTYKNLIVRLQAPRFFTQKDEVVLSANVHNYLATKKTVRVRLELEGPTLGPVHWSYREPVKATDKDAHFELTNAIDVEPNSDKRVDFPVVVFNPGTAIVRMKAITDEESDATQMSFPVQIHGMLKTESYSGALRPDEQAASLTFNVPNERLPEQSRIEVRYSPSVASAMVDALPYLVDYPYGCTEQTLNRFLPTVITQKVLISMNLNLKDIEKKRTNLNAQEIGDDPKRAADWKRNNPPNPGVAERNPVFDEAEVLAMTKAGLERLTNMQCADGGWGWFGGFSEQSWPHTTATVVHGLQIASQNDVALVPGVLDRGVEWLKRYQAMQVAMLKNFPARVIPYKEHADELDAFVYMVLADANVHDKEMDDFLYRDRTEIAVYAKALYGLAIQKQGERDRLDMILQNLSQYVVQDNENQTAYLRLPENNWWWTWYGSDTEAMAYYLKLLARTDPKGQVASRLSKYLINNRKHASYWNSTRDTALCIEALADYVKASGEDRPDETITIALDGRKVKEVHIDANNLFSYDNRFVWTGAEIPAGAHKLEFTKAGTGPLYFNTYVTNFTLEDPIKRAGLEIKVGRKFYKLERVDATAKVEGQHGQALDQKVEKYERHELADAAQVKSGDLIEIELEIDSKNDYEYVLFEDMKAAGFEPVDTQSGYNGNDLNAYMELRDNRVCFFARTLSRGKHSVAYRVRAEIPGKFNALPTRASAMYAPELKANSDEMKIGIAD